MTGIARLGLIGIGLIGSSIARALAGSGHCRVRLFDIDPEVRRMAAGLNLGDIVETEAQACADADLVILCTPPGALVSAARACLPVLTSHAIISDVGSVKTPFAEAMRAEKATRRSCVIIPAHPIAGTEQSGPEAGRADLFAGRWCVLTPLSAPGADPDADAALARLDGFWRGLGAEVCVMDASKHDRILAMTSHAPHLIAYNLVASAMSSERVDMTDLVAFSAGGFRDFTRIAASDPLMWRDVFLANADEVVAAIGEFRAGMDRLVAAIQKGDGESLRMMFARAREVREAIIAAGQETAKADFGRDSLG